MRDGFLTKEDLEGKHVFWDVDGVLAPFRFNDKIWPNENRFKALNQDMVNSGAFYNRAPCKLVQRIIQQSGAKKHLVLGKYVYDGEIAQKKRWLAEFYPEISEYIWVPVHTSKSEFIYEYMCSLNLKPDDMVFIDDTIDELQSAEKGVGVLSVHISSLLNWEE